MKTKPKANGLLRWLSGTLSVLATPGCWLQLYPFSKDWDRWLNKKMESEDFSDITKFTAKLGGVEIWVANHPYASLRPYKLEIRPSRATILRAHRKLVVDSLK